MIKRCGSGTVKIAAGLLLALVLLGSLFAQAQTLPPKPDTYVTDQAGVLDSSTVAALNTQLDQEEKDTSNQILVAIYPSLPQDAEVAQYSTDTYNAWGVGQKGKDNGAVLFVFVQDRKMFIATGRGLEGALPDAICKRIVTQIITPQFKQGNYSGGVQAGVNAMLAASKGEFKGDGSTVYDQNQQVPDWVGVVIFIVLIFFFVFVFPRFNSGPIIFTGGGWGGGGGGDSFGGGGFSGGGGSSAGGGAGGGW